MGNGALMTIEDLSGYLKVTRRTIYEWLKTNKIPAVKLIGQWRFQKEKIDAWLENKSKSIVKHAALSDRPVSATAEGEHYVS